MARVVGAFAALQALIFLVVMLLAAVGPAGAASGRLWSDCRSSEPVVSVSACTDLIETSSGSKDDLAIMYSNRGDAYAAEGEYGRAIGDYSDAIRLSDKRAAYAHDARGNAYSEIGEPDHALEDYTATIRLSPDDSTAYF